MGKSQEVHLIDEALIEKALAERSFWHFVRQAFKIVEPGKEFRDGYHIHAICEHLEAISRGDIRNLIINIPPRHMKSLLVSVLWHPWEWIHRPELRYITASYAAPLSIRDTMKSRRIITSDWYQDNWGDRVQLASDQNEKKKFENTQGGLRFSTSVGGTATGEGGDRLLMDDPSPAKVGKQVDSKQLVEALDFWTETMSTRGNDPKTVAKVVVMQRLHQSDLTGGLMESDEHYELLVLPARYEVGRSFTCLGKDVCDKRTVEGELLWTEQFDEEALSRIETALGAYGTAAQHAQKPVPRGGAIFKDRWFRRFDLGAARSGGMIFQSWDTATSKKKENAPSVCTTWWRRGKDMYLLDVFRSHVEFVDLLKVAFLLAAKWKPNSILVEDKSSGRQLLQYIEKMDKSDEGRWVKELYLNTFPRLTMIPIEPCGSKEERAEAVTTEFEAGSVLFPETAPWLPEYETELLTFPRSTYADQVDSTTQGITWSVNRSVKPSTRVST